MKRIGVIIGTERQPEEEEIKYYQKHKKQFDKTLEDLQLNGLQDLSYDIQIFSWLQRNCPNNIEIVPLWKTSFTKKDLDNLDVVFSLYEFTYAFIDSGQKGVKQYFNLIDHTTKTKTQVHPTPELQRFIMNKSKYMNYFKKKGFPLLDTIYMNINTYTTKNQKEKMKIFERIVKRFKGPIFCKPELGGFAVGTKLFKKPLFKSFDNYLAKAESNGYNKLLIQPYIEEFLKFHEIKTLWINGKFQYAYGTKVASYEDTYIRQSEIDAKLLKTLKQKGREIIKTLTKDFGLPFILRIDWGCCLINDNICRDYFLNEIECCPAMVFEDDESRDPFNYLAKQIIKLV